MSLFKEYKFSELGRRFDFNDFVGVKYESKKQKWTSEGKEISMNNSSSQGNVIFLMFNFYNFYIQGVHIIRTI